MIPRKDSYQSGNLGILYRKDRKQYRKDNNFLELIPEKSSLLKPLPVDISGHCPILASNVQVCQIMSNVVQDCPVLSNKIQIQDEQFLRDALMPNSHILIQ